MPPVVVTVNVSGGACIWYAWALDSQLVPGNVPYTETTANRPAIVTIPAGANWVSIQALGNWGHTPSSSDTSGPDGLPNFLTALDDSTTSAYNPDGSIHYRSSTIQGSLLIDGIDTRVNQLVGVWQHGSSVPPTVTTNEFAIGSSYQGFIPSDATFLFMGLHDGFQWSNNTGSVTATLQFETVYTSVGPPNCSPGTFSTSPPPTNLGPPLSAQACSACGCSPSSPSTPGPTPPQATAIDPCSSSIGGSSSSAGTTTSSTATSAIDRANSLANVVNSLLPPSLDLVGNGGVADPPFSIDPFTGNLSFKFPTPLGYPFAPPIALYYNSQASNTDPVFGDTALGNKWSTNLRAGISTPDSNYVAQVSKGTGLLLPYTLTATLTAGSIYNPPGGYSQLIATGRPRLDGN